MVITPMRTRARSSTLSVHDDEVRMRWVRLPNLPPDAQRAENAIRAQPNGQLAMSPTEFGALVDAMCGPRAQPEREQLAVALIAIALKSTKLAPKNTKLAVAQLGVLLAVLLRDVVTAERALFAAGIDRAAIRMASAAAEKLRARIYDADTSMEGGALG